MAELLDPISRDSDPLSRARRLRAIERDIALRATGRPCTTCRNTARSARGGGGRGCSCVTNAAELRERCLLAAARAAS
jgi:hypothetical protein